MAYIIQTKDIKKTSSNKWCENCNKHIKVGKPSIAIECYDGEFYETNVCSVGCMEEYEKSLIIKTEDDIQQDINIIASESFDKEWKDEDNNYWGSYL